MAKYLFPKGEDNPNWKGGKELLYQSLPNCPDCNKKLSAKHVTRCRSCAFKLQRNENHPNWISDRTTLKRIGTRRCSDYMIWRRRVWERDNHTCKINNGDCSGRLESHHILGFATHPELRYEVSNGITLCHFHHPRKRNDEMRLIPTFRELVNRESI